MFNDDSEQEQYYPIRRERRNRRVRRVVNKNGLSKPVTLGSLLAIMIVLLGSITATQLWTMQLANQAQIAAAARPDAYTFSEARKASYLHDMVHDKEEDSIRREISNRLASLDERLSRAIEAFEGSSPPIKSNIADMKMKISFDEMMRVSD